MKRITFTMLRAVAVLVSPMLLMAAEQVPNPAYKNWAKFKVGSWSELTTTMQMKGMPAGMSMGGMKMTLKLVELTDDKAVVEASMTMNMGGQTRAMPAQRQEIPAKVDADKVDETGMPRQSGVKTDVKKGEGEVSVMGKTLKCQWFEFTTTQQGQSATGKVWISTEIPGGMVQSDMHMEQGDTNMKLTGYEVAK